MSRPLLLLSNDDGIAAPGLAVLRAALEPLADLVVVAPERNQSAVSHGLTLHQVIRQRSVGPGLYALEGTPADCVYVALNAVGELLPRRPDLVLSGINNGPNLGVDVHYSGTVAAAREAALRGVSALAISAASESGFETAAQVASALVLALSAAPSPRPPGRAVLLNVNVPEHEPLGIRATRLGSRTYADEVVGRLDPRQRPYLWIGSAMIEPNGDDGPDCDTSAFHAGFVSVTPLLTDVSATADRPFVEALLGALGR